MADYSIQLGVKVDTKGIDTAINKYQGKPIEVKSKLDTSGIDKKIASYKVKKPIEINTKLNTSGLAKKISEYKPKTPIKLNAKLDTNDISTALRNYKAKTPIKVDIKLDSSDISKQIKAYKAKTPIKVDIKLDSNDITKQIRNYQAKAPIKLNVKLTTKDIDEKIRAYKAKTPIKLDVKINNSAINEQIKSFNPKTTIKLKAALQKGAIADEIRKFKPSAPIKVDLELNYSDIDKKVGEYIATKGAVELPVKLKPAKAGFSDSVTKKPVEVSATLEPSDINKAIDNFKATSKIKVDVKLEPKDISAQIQKLPKPTEPISVDVDLNESSINAAIKSFQPTAKLGVKPDLVLEDVDDQIRAYVPKTKVKVNIDLNDIAAEAGNQNVQPPITVNAKLDRDDINTQIKNFKTNSKIKVGVKLDFASHKDDAGNEIQKGISKQIKDFETKTKVKIGVQLDKDSIKQEVQNIKVNTPIQVGVELDPDGIKNIQNQINTLKQQIQALGNIQINLGGSGTGSSSNVSNAASSANKALREVYDLYKQIESMELKLGKLKLSGVDSGNITEYRTKLDNLRKTYENLFATMSGKNGAINLDSVFVDIDKAKTLIKELLSSFDNARTKLSEDIKLDIDSGKLKGEINSVKESFNLLNVESQKVTDGINKLENLLGRMDTSDDIESVTSDYQEFLQLLKTVKNSVKELQNAQSNSSEMLDLKKASAMEKLNNMFEDGSQAARRFGERARQLKEELNNCGNANIGNVTKKVQILGDEVKRSSLQTKTLGSRLKEQFSKYGQYISVASVIMYATQGLRSMFEQVKLIDSAMTELKKVTDETDASYDQFLSNAASRAKEIGTTIDGLVSSTADFARLGYDFADAQGLAEVANIYAVVGDEIEGVEDATQSLISTLAAFKSEIGDMDNDEFALSIVDKMNEVANNYAISSGGLGEALQRSASSMAAANNSLDETIALITAANEVTQNPEKVGNAMKTISMRIRGAKTELEEAGESTDGMAESTASLRQEMLALSGVDIMLNENTFKSTYQIMDELSQKWEGLSDIAQATITELLAGKHQGNVMSSLMSNFDTARNALETSLNSSGSAMKEHEKWSQSLEAQLLKLKAAWQGLSQAFLSSDFLKGTLNVVIELVDGIAKLIDTIGAVPTLLTGFAGFKVLFTLFKSGGISGIKSFADVLSLLKLAFPNISDGASKLVSVLRKMAGASAGANVGVGGLLKTVLTGNPYITAAVIAVTALTAAFAYQKKKAEDLAQAVEETVSSYKEQHNELIKLKNDYDASSESSMISKYAKLSKGVDGLGRNISLTADEYSEYQSIVNSIAEQIPSLVSGYDEQGNAILSCKGNVEELTNAYQKLIHEQNRAVLTNTGNIEKDFSNTLEKQSGTHWWSNNHGFWAGLDIFGWGNYELKTDTAKGIEALLNASSEAEKDRIIRSLQTNMYSGEEIKDVLEGAGIDVKWGENVYDVLEKTLKTDPQKIKNIIDDYYAQFDDAIAEQKTIAQAKLSEAFDVSSAISGLDYGNISKELQDIAKQTVNSLDFDFFSSLQEQGKTVEQWTTELLNQLNSISEVDNTQIEAAFDLQTKFNGGDISYGEYVKSLKDVGSTIDKLDLKDEAKEQLEISLGLDDSGIVDQYDALVKRLTSKEIGLNDKAAKNLLDSLSAEELDVLVDIIPNLDAGMTVNEIQSLIDEKLATEFTFDISAQITGIEAFNTALSEARSATGLTSESIAALQGRYEDLEGFNAGALFERTANGVRVNNEELARLEAQYENVNKLDIDKNLSKLVNKYKDLTEKIKTCTDAQKKESLQLQADAYSDKIEELQTLAAQYDGLTSAFSKWQQAQSSPNDGDNYDSVFESLEALQESYKAGLVGTDDFRAAVQLMSNEDLSTASVDKLVSVYKDGLPKMKRYFTEGQKGCQNFLNDVSKLNSEWAHLNEKGEWEINIDVEEAAEKLNMDVSTIHLILDKLKDYGFEINIDDTSLKNLQTDIEKSEARLKELGRTPQPINLDTSDIETIDGEISKLKAHISEVKDDSSLSVEVKTAELDDARAKLEALIQKKQEASQPAFMNLDTSQVKSSMVEALGYVQDYQNSLDDLNILLELKEAGITIDDSEVDAAQKKLDECAKLIQGLDGDVKLAIGLEEDASIDDIKKAIANGDVVIDTDTSTADIKIEKLADNIERIEDKDVTINVTVNGLEEVEELNRQIDLATNIDGDIDSLTEYVEGAKALSDLDSNIVTNVTANITGNVKDTPEFAINNLETFAKGAKELKGVGTFSSKVTADIAGNVKDTPEFAINNLKVFSESAKGIEDIGDVKAKITADIAGNVKDTPEFSINNLKVFTDNAKDIENIGEDVKAKITADIEGNVKDTPEFAINNLKVFTDNAKDIEETGNVSSEVTANVKGNVVDTYEYQLDNLKKYTDSAKDIEKTGNVESKVTANVEGNVVDTFEYQLDNLKVFTDSAKDIESVGDVESKVTANVEGNVVDTFEYKIDNLKTYSDNAANVEKIGNVTSKVEANVNGNVIDEFEYKLDNLKVFSDSAKDVKDIGTVESKVTANVDGNVIDEFEYKLNNLKVFSDSAKDIGDIGNVSSNVKANIEGNVIDEFEYKIDNIEVFAEGAKTLKGIGNVDSKVTADVGGNVIDTKEYKINNLKAYTDNAKNVESIGNVTSKVTADVAGNVIDTKEYKIDNLKAYTDSAKKVESIGTVTSSVKADIGGNVIDTKEYKINNLEVFGESAKNIKSIGTVNSSVTANVDGNVINTTEEKIDNLGVFANNANKLKNTGNFTSSVTASVGGNIITDDTAVTDLEHFTSVVSGMTSQTVTVSVTANVDSANINSAIALLTGLNNSGIFKDYNATVQVGAKIAKIDDATVKNYKVPKKEGTVVYNVDSSKVDAWKAPSKNGVVNYSAEVEALTSAQKHKTGTITYKANIVGLGPAAGTAHASGSANASGSTGRSFARGDWGIKGNGVALGGEMGREIVVRDGKFFTIGDNGAEFFRYRKNDIVFNATQTEALLKYGGLKGANPRGKMLATGTAFAEGNAFATASGGGKFYNSSTGQSYGSSSSSSSSSDSSSDQEFEEVIDWIEVILDRVERSIDKFDQQANNIYKSWSSRNTALQSQISEVSREINLQQQAYNKYMSAANGVGLSSSWASKVRNGAIDIDTVKDEALADKIKSYQEYYEKALDAKKAVEELREEESKLYAQRVENVAAQYEGILGVVEHEKNMLEEYISQSEAQGWLVSAKYYDALASNEKDNIAQLQKEKSAMLKELQTAMQSGTIAKGSEAWYEMVNSIDEVTLSIAESETALKEYQQTIQELDFEVFDILQERISAVSEEAEFLIELLSSDKLFDDKGQLTESGRATLGLHGQNYNTYMYQSDKYASEIADLDKEIAKDPYDQDLINRRQELVSLQQEAILAAQQEKESIRDLIDEGYSAQLDSLQELIDKKNEALESERDLYEYQKKVKEQTQEISALEKQMAAYAGDDSEEARQKVQQIKVDLEAARQDLEETETDRLIESTATLLDELYLEAETLLNTRLDNLDALVTDVITQINTDATSISTTLSEKADSVGYTLSDSISTIWDTNSTKINNVITNYGDKFTSAQTTTNNALSTINTNLQNVITQLNSIAKTNVKSASTSSASNSKQANASTSNKTSSTTNKNTTSTATKSFAVGGKINAKGAQIYDYAGDTSGERQLYRDDPIYKILQTSGSWLQVRWHKLSSGITGWFRKGDVRAYATGKRSIQEDQMAWTQEKGREFIVRPSDGAILTPVAKNDSVLNAAASGNIWNMANNPVEFIKDNLKLDASNVPNTSNVNNSITQHFENVVFSMPNVHGYNDLLKEMQSDPKFEKLILSMTIDQIAGRSKLAKGKSIR